MNKALVALVVFALQVGITGIGMTKEAESARNVVAKLAARARQWQSDAVLTNLSTFSAAQDGTAATWSSMFYSPVTKKWLAVTASGAKLDALEVSEGLTDPIGEFIDSDRAMQVAKKNGVTPGRETLMGLAWTGAKDGLACWTVGGGFEPGSVAVVLNAKTGDLITKHQTP